MSRLLVIEPNLMLRHALAVALTPDHQAQFVDALPQAPALQNIDGIIVDAAMLRQGAKPSPVDLETVQRWRVPTVWIDDSEPALGPARVDWVTVKMPVQRERLLKALFDCLNLTARPTAAARKSEAKTTLPAKTRVKKNTEANTATTPASNVIELVEVVDEESEGG